MQYVVVDHGYNPEIVTIITAKTVFEVLQKYIKNWNPDPRNVTIKLITGSS